MVPSDATDNPAGRPDAVHVYGSVPPDAFSDAEYAVFKKPGGRVDVATVNEFVIVTVKVLVAFVPVESVTVTDTGISCAVVGVPVTAPLDETLNPSPADPAHVYGPVPPVAENWPEYGWFI